MTDAKPKWVNGVCPLDGNLRENPELHLDMAHGIVRALEAELAEYERRSQANAEQRRLDREEQMLTNRTLAEKFEKAEAELEAHRIAKSENNPRGYRAVPGTLYDETVARAEKAEARVRELEAELADVKERLDKRYAEELQVIAERDAYKAAADCIPHIRDAELAKLREAKP